jgi:hypothetical protein
MMKASLGLIGSTQRAAVTEHVTGTGMQSCGVP